MVTVTDIIKAYCKIRESNNTIPDDVLDFMKESSIEKIEKIKEEKEIKNLIN